MEWNIALLLYAVVQFIAFFCVLVATPLDMFRFRVNFFNITGCLTLWGFKDKCSDISHNFTVYRVWDECPGRLRLFRAVEAFAIVSILVYGTAFVLGVVMLFCRLILRWICLGLNIAGAITVCFVWASMVVAFLRDGDGPCPALQIFAQYGVGFALFVVAWVLDIINIFLLVLSIGTTISTESGQVEQKEGTL
ncbi:amastin-like surface protein, putative [Leishmania panamensis]|uniref:Amastin-like surface protein, putative n=1 Tax=Leishmania panamensis TaxID=5679 RepID=A0AC62A6A4_LEIPA